MYSIYHIWFIFWTITVLNGDENGVKELADGSRSLTAAIYKELIRTSDANLVFSPFSLEVLVALLAEGTKGDTRHQLISGIFLPPSTINTEQIFKTLSKKLHDNGNYFTIGSANKIYVADNIKINENFRKIAKEYYDSDIQNINFNDKPNAARSINNWVQEHTFNKVQNLLEPEDIEIGLMLVNAIYLNATWLHRFHSQGSFYFNNLDNTKTPVTSMSKTHAFLYYENKDLEAEFMEIPYRDNNQDGLSMTIVLPKKMSGLNKLEKNLNKVFQRQPLQPNEVQVKMPKFTIKSKTDLRDVLRSLGITNIFHSTQSDLSNLVENSGGLHVSNVIQKTFIDVTKDGTEAAAASASVIMRSTEFEDGRSIKFNVDHPFIFYIRREGVILFAGRVAKL